MFISKAVVCGLTGVLAAGALGMAVAPQARAAGAIGGGGGTSGDGVNGGDQSIYTCVEDGIVLAYGKPYTLPDGCGSTTFNWVSCVTGAYVFNFYGTAANPARSVSLSRVNSRSWNFCLTESQKKRVPIETFYYPPTSPGSSSARDGSDSGIGAPYVKLTGGQTETSVLEMEKSSYKGYPEYLTRSWAANIPFTSVRKTDEFYDSLNASFPEVQGQAFLGAGGACQTTGGTKYDNYWTYWLSAYRTGGQKGDYLPDFTGKRGLAEDKRFLTRLTKSVAAISGNSGSMGAATRVVGDATLGSVGLSAASSRDVRSRIDKYISASGGPATVRTPYITSAQFNSVLLRMAAGVGIPVGGAAQLNPIKGADANAVITTLLNPASYVDNIPCYSPAQYVVKFPKKAAPTLKTRRAYTENNPEKYPVTGVGVILLERPAYLMRRANGTIGLEFRTFDAGFGEKLVPSDRASSIDRFATCTGPDSKRLASRMTLGNSTQDLSESALVKIRDAYCDSAFSLFKNATSDGFVKENRRNKNNPIQMYPGPFLNVRPGNTIPAYAQDSPLNKSDKQLSDIASAQLVGEVGMRMFLTNFVAEEAPEPCVGDDCAWVEVTPVNPPVVASTSTLAVVSPRPYRVGGALRPESANIETNLPPTTNRFTYDVQVLPPAGYRYCTPTQAASDSTCDFTYTISHRGSAAIRTGSTVDFKFYRATRPGTDIQVRVVNAQGTYTVVVPGERRRVCTVRPAPTPDPVRPVVPTPRTGPSAGPNPAPAPAPIRTCRWVRDPDRIEERPIVPSATIWSPGQSAYVQMTPLGSNSWYFTSPVVSATDNP